MIAKGEGWELRCGRWQDVLADVERCDAVIADPPYTPRVEAGTRSGSDSGPVSGTIHYGTIAEADCIDLASYVVSKRAFWSVVFNDHIGWRWLEKAHQGAGLYTFAPVVWCKEAAAPRFAGDGPATAVEHILVARRREKMRPDDTASRPGFYTAVRAVRGAMSNGAVVVGAKPVGLMRAIVRDYSRPGDLIVDPYAGGGTTLLAAVMEGRRAIGAEVDPVTFAKAAERLRGMGTHDPAGQLNIFGGAV